MAERQDARERYVEPRINRSRRHTLAFGETVDHTAQPRPIGVGFGARIADHRNHVVLGLAAVHYHGKLTLCSPSKLVTKEFALLVGRHVVVVVESNLTNPDDVRTR